MKIVDIEFGKDHTVIYDPFIANTYDENFVGNAIINVSLDHAQLKKLSAFIWETYKNIQKEYEGDDMDYFENNSEEPFPDSGDTITDNPLLIDDYMRKSFLWRDTILEKFLFIPGADAICYFVIKYKECTIWEDGLTLSFFAIVAKPE